MTTSGPLDEDQEETATTTGGDDGEKPSLDTVFAVLSNVHRRFTLYYLTERENEATLPELAAQIAAWEDGTAPDTVGTERTERVLASLSHVHLPKLAATNFIKYDEETGAVAPTNRTEHIRPYLKLSERADF